MCVSISMWNQFWCQKFRYQRNSFRGFKDWFSRKIWTTENSYNLHTVAHFATTEFRTTFYFVSLVGWLDYLLICQNGGMNLTKSFHEYIQKSFRIWDSKFFDELCWKIWILTVNNMEFGKTKNLVKSVSNKIHLQSFCKV